MKVRARVLEKIETDQETKYNFSYIQNLLYGGNNGNIDFSKSRRFRHGNLSAHRAGLFERKSR